MGEYAECQALKESGKTAPFVSVFGAWPMFGHPTSPAESSFKLENGWDMSPQA